MRSGICGSVLSFLWLSAAPDGCGGDESVPLAQLPSRLATAQCGRVFRCCSLAQIQQLYGATVTDEATCVDQLTLAGNLLMSGVMDSQNAGRLSYNGATAATCFRELGTAACTPASNLWSIVPECDAYLEPLVSAGGACGSDGECRTGFCDRPPTTTGDGMCNEIPTKGMTCTSRCATGSTCDTVLSTCVDPKADGSFCIADVDCVSGNCDNPALTGGTCAPAPAATCGPSP